MGIMGQPMAKNLLAKGLEVTVWNRDGSKCAELVQAGAKQAGTAAECVAASDIAVAMLSDPAAATAVVFGPDGVLGAIDSTKSYVDMSTVDADTSTKICEAITAAGGRFLEAPVSGSKGPAIQGQLIILAAGDEALFKECELAFDAMGKKAFFLGACGAGAKMKLVVNMVMGSMMGAFAEGMALADVAGLSQEDLLEVLSLGAMANPMFALKGPAVMKREFPPAFPLKHQQKDMRLALALGDELNQPLPIAAASNERYKQAKAAGHADNDFAAIYNATRPAQ
eukprot:CAMPEP_0118933128 /NCGR_PEP_ID=MMETSP1169-20130426/11367_1 /TAXON_ID=36882 /ORGANISM="Pyramimonas obovata, Strain CCMP722" /LENGTH=281 /DNA_ID=CAMNT_0006875855 /DNA_START=122 /DNA_END=967 /DNA_ORIENTATION=+